MVENKQDARKFASIFCNPVHTECVYMYMCGRKKYDPSLGTKYGCLNRALLHPGADFLENVNHLWAQQYKTDHGVPITGSALACYTGLNARDTRKAAAKLAKSILDSLEDPTDKPPYYNIPSQFKTLVHGTPDCKSRFWCVLDIDEKSFLTRVQAVLEQYDIEPRCIIETRGGYHVVLHTASLSRPLLKGAVNEGGRTFGEYLHKHMLGWKQTDDPSKSAVEFMKDPFSPVPGTRQGGFLVRFEECSP
jgi:hypothetical protein